VDTTHNPMTSCGKTDVQEVVAGSHNQRTNLLIQMRTDSHTVITDQTPTVDFNDSEGFSKKFPELLSLSITLNIAS
jgi:hypothetical protein